jgi:hypothetical protein
MKPKLIFYNTWVHHTEEIRRNVFKVYWECIIKFEDGHKEDYILTSDERDDMWFLVKKYLSK